MDEATLTKALQDALGKNSQHVILWVVSINAIAFLINLGLTEFLRRKFKAFEDKLDRAASREAAIIDNLQPERVKAALELAPMCSEAISKVSVFVGLQSILFDSDKLRSKDDIREAHAEAEKMLTVFTIRFNALQVLFDERTKAVMDDLYKYAIEIIIKLHWDAENKESHKMEETLNEKRRNFLNDMQRVVGSKEMQK